LESSLKAWKSSVLKVKYSDVSVILVFCRGFGVMQSFWCFCCVILLSEASGESKLLVVCDVFAYNFLVKQDMKMILMCEIQKSVMQKVCCFWFFDIFVGC